MKKVIYSLLLLLVAFGFQSCSHDENNIFSENASERIEKAVTVDQQILESASNGWKLNYYPGEGYSKGGYAYIVKFKNGKVTIATELAGSDSTFTSDYAMVKDQGPVLTFNTYNPFLHCFSEESISNIDTYQGDYEFVVSKATTDSIVMTGKKWGNKMIMTRMSNNVKWSVYLDSIKNSINNILCNLKYMNGNDSIAHVVLNTDTRMATITTSEGQSSIAFTPTADGISFCEPLNVSNSSVQNLMWNGKDTFLPTSTSKASLTFSHSAGYHYIDEITGTYNLYFNSGTEYYTLTLKPNAEKTELIAHCNAFPFNIKFTYSKSTGSMFLKGQDIGPYKINDVTYDIELVPGYLGSNPYAWSDGYCMNLVPVSGKDFCYKFVDKEKWWGLHTDSYFFEACLNGEREGYILSWPYVTYLVKTN